MSKKPIFLLFALSLFGFQLSGQEVWDLEKCILHARKNSLDVRSAEINIKVAEETEKANKMARLPNLNFNSDGQFNFGRRIDFTTNEFTNARLFNNSMSVSSTMPLYQGGRINNSIKQSKYSTAAARASADEISNNISLQVANAYLQILFSDEQLLNARKTLEQSQQQLSQTDRLIQAGTLPVGDRLPILATIAQNEQTIIIQENNLEINYLTLKNLLMLEPDFDLRIKKPQVSVEAYEQATISQFGETYKMALQSQPQIRAGDMRLRAAEMQVEVTKAAMRPSLNLFAGMSSNHSSANSDFSQPDETNASIVPDRTVNVLVDGQASTLTTFRTDGVTFPRLSYGTQLSDNLGQWAGISLNVPIFNRGQNSFAMERDRLNVISTEVQNQQIRQQLKADVQNAIAQAKSAKRALVAARKSVEALDLTYQNAQRRFDLGAINSFELTTAKNNYDQSQVDLIVAKYDYLFRLKIVDFYMGTPMRLD
ncbi:MAG: TolC family protein [Bacteroidota bacterium]